MKIFVGILSKYEKIEEELHPPASLSNSSTANRGHFLRFLLLRFNDREKLMSKHTHINATLILEKSYLCFCEFRKK